jgi:hypothetical protein
MQNFNRWAWCCLLLASGQAMATPVCPTLEAAPAAFCIASAHGLAYAETEADAQAASRAQAEAADRFTTYFGDAPQGVLVLSTSYSADAARSFARAKGLGYGMVWLPADASWAMLKRATRQAGRKPSRSNLSRSAVFDQQVDILRHELGHAMYAHAYWPAEPIVANQRYGSPAPDWLDEAAANFMEPPQAQSARVSHYLAEARRSPHITPPLTELLAAVHPVLAAGMGRAMARAPTSASGVRVFTTTGDPYRLGRFYGLSSLFGMFLIDASGDGRVLASVSQAYKDGGTFESWLARDGAARGLPATLPALQIAWDAWHRKLTSGGQSATNPST